MAQEPDEDFDGGEGEAEFEGGGGGGGKKKLLLMVVLPLVLVLGGGAAAFFSGAADPLIAMITGGDKSADAEHGAEQPPEAAHAPTAEADLSQPVFFQLQDMTVNISSGRRRSVLKVAFVLEVPSEADVARVTELEFRIRDSFLIYLKELRPEDLEGSAGTFRLKEELLARVNAAVRPTQIRDVLWKEFIVQ